MIRIIKELNIEVTKPNVFQALVAKQYDMNTRFLKVTLTDCGSVINVPYSDNVKVVINAQRIDGQSKGFDGEVNEDGTLTVPLHSWMLELEGLVICDISVIQTAENDNKKLTTTSFELMVEKAAYGGDDVTNDPQYDVLVELIERVENLEAGGGGGGIVDQTYNPESENPQSGKAVNEALTVLQEFDIDGSLELSELTTLKSVITEIADLDIYKDDDGSIMTIYVYTDFCLFQTMDSSVNLSVGDKLYIEIGECVYEDECRYKCNKMAVVRDKYLTEENVDQTYNPTSENAQSGIAINEALYTKVEIPAEYIYGIPFNEGYERANGVYKITSTECGIDYMLCGDFGSVYMSTTMVAEGTNLHDSEYFYVEFDEQSSEVSKFIVYISKYGSHKIQTFTNSVHLLLEDNVEYIADEPIYELYISYPSGNFISSITFTVHPDYGIELYLPSDTKYIGGVPEFKNGQTWELNIKNGVVVGGLVECIY